MRIDPTYCPDPQNYTMEDFKKKPQKNPHVLSFPSTPTPQSYLHINEEWMGKNCETLLQYYEGAQGFSIKNLYKFLRLICTLLSCFEKEKRIDTYYYKYNLGDTDLSLDVNLFPLSIGPWFV